MGSQDVGKRKQLESQGLNARTFNNANAAKIFKTGTDEY